LILISLNNIIIKLACKLYYAKVIKNPKMYNIIFKYINKKAPKSIDYGAFLCYDKKGMLRQDKIC
jgi:hypothetical protein